MIDELLEQIAIAIYCYGWYSARFKPEVAHDIREHAMMQALNFVEVHSDDITRDAPIFIKHHGLCVSKFISHYDDIMQALVRLANQSISMFGINIIGETMMIPPRQLFESETTIEAFAHIVPNCHKRFIQEYIKRRKTVSTVGRDKQLRLLYKTVTGLAKADIDTDYHDSSQGALWDALGLKMEPQIK